MENITFYVFNLNFTDIFRLHSMNLAAFLCFFVSVVDLWSIIWVLHSSGSLVSALFLYFQLTLTGMRRGSYLFIIMLITKGVFYGRSG